MTTPAHPATTRRLVPSLLRSPVLWAAAAATFVASPALFLTTLALGAVVIVVGLFQWAGSRRAWPLAVGIGLVVGSLPYSIAAVVHLVSR